MPTISVIVPVYKVEPYLNRCVDSILRQTYQDFELILVDDGSPDRCGEICDEYARQDSRVHVIHKENGGLSDARNAGIDWVEANSDSRWLIFADSDDWVHPELLTRLLDAATAFDLKISVCGYQETEGADPAVLPEDMRPCRWTPKQFYMEHFVNATVAWGKLYSRSCFRGIRYPVGKIHEDEFVTYRLLFAQKEIAVVPAPLYAYFINPKGIIRSAWSPKRFHAWEAYDQQLAFFTAMGDEELVKFRIRGYLDNALANLYTAEQADNAAELTADKLPEGFASIPLPGHFFDMVGFRTPDDVVFLADCLSSREILDKYQIGFIYDVAGYLKTLEQVQTMTAKVFVPAHTEVTEDIADLAQYNIRKVHEIAERIVDLCAAPRGFEDILQQLFAAYGLTMSFEQYVLVGSTVRSYLAWLKDTGRLTALFEDGWMRWARV